MSIIKIPEHLGIDAPDSMPIIELVQVLLTKGYHLKNNMKGDLVAIPICEHRNLSRQNGHWYCECGSIFTDSDLEAVNPITDDPSWDDVCSCCLQRRRECRCSLFNSENDYEH